MTLDDMAPAGVAAQAVVRAVDADVCGLVQRGESNPILQPHGLQLKLHAADGGGFEVTRVLWQDAELMHANVELRGVPNSSSAAWLASVVRRGDVWAMETFARLQP